MAGLARRAIHAAGRGGARAASWAMLGQVSAIVASTANFVLLARILGAEQYGLIAGTWTLVLAVAPVAAIGSDRLLVRDVSADKLQAGHALGLALATMVVGWAVVIGALAALHPWLLPQTPLELLLLLAFADIVALNTVTVIGALCFATQNAKIAAISSVVVNITKLLAVVAFALTGDPDPVRWAVFYAALSLLSAAGQLWYAVRRFGALSMGGYHLLRRIRDGVPYSANVMSMVVQNDADKTLLVRAGMAEAAGQYSVAYRLASIAYLPVLAVLQTTFPRFFALGKDGGLAATSAFGRRLAAPLLVYGLAAGGGLVACAPLIPSVVGAEYEPSVQLLWLLAPIVMLKIVESVTGDVLTGAGLQKTRTVCVAVAAATNVAVNLVLIPRMGVAGAVIATYVAELLQATLLLVAVDRGLRRPSLKTSDT